MTRSSFFDKGSQSFPNYGPTGAMFPWAHLYSPLSLWEAKSQGILVMQSVKKQSMENEWKVYLYAEYMGHHSVLISDIF